MDPNYCDRGVLLASITELKKELTEQHIKQITSENSPLGIGEGVASFSISEEQMKAMLSVEDIQKKIDYLEDILKSLPEDKYVGTWSEKIIPFLATIDLVKPNSFSIVYKDDELTFNLK